MGFRKIISIKLISIDGILPLPLDGGGLGWGCLVVSFHPPLYPLPLREGIN
jgi:hypothetical protein